MLTIHHDFLIIKYDIINVNEINVTCSFTKSRPKHHWWVLPFEFGHAAVELVPAARMLFELVARLRVPVVRLLRPVVLHLVVRLLHLVVLGLLQVVGRSIELVGYSEIK